MNFVPNRRLSPQEYFRFYGRAELFLKTRSARRRFMERLVKRSLRLIEEIYRQFNLYLI